jgi:hypothetical protein
MMFKFYGIYVHHESDSVFIAGIDFKHDGDVDPRHDRSLTKKQAQEQAWVLAGKLQYRYSEVTNG